MGAALDARIRLRPWCFLSGFRWFLGGLWVSGSWSQEMPLTALRGGWEELRRLTRNSPGPKSTSPEHFKTSEAALNFRAWGCLSCADPLAIPARRCGSSAFVQA